MKKITFIFSVFFLLTTLVTSCGGSGETFTNVTSHTTSDSGDFTGYYAPRDTNCFGTTLGVFKIIQEGYHLTLISVDPPKMSSLIQGDRFSAIRNIAQDAAGKSYYSIEASSLGCFGLILKTQNQVDLVLNNSLIKAGLGDLLFTCFDNSSDGVCDTTYARQFGDLKENQ